MATPTKPAGARIQGSTVAELTASYQAAVQALQGELMAKIMAAQAGGNVAAMQEASLSLQAALQGVATEFQEAMARLQAGAPATPLYAWPTRVDKALIVYDGDRDAFIAFNRDADVQTAWQQVQQQAGQWSARKQLLKTSLKLTPKLAPTVYGIGKRCRDVLGLECKIEFFVYQGDQFNASVYPPSGDTLYIMLSSGIIERFNTDELTFVIGHEIGHVIFEHHKYPARLIMDAGSEYLSPLHAMKLFAWGRSAELTADRVGLLCCQDFTAAARAFFKLSSGVTDESLAFDLEEYVKQFVDLEAEMAGENMDPSDWYSTHPFSPLRIKAIEIFHRSDTFKRLTGSGEASVTESEMEAEIARFMSLMDPSYLTQDAGGDIQRYLFLAGYLIAGADGHVDDVEVQTLGRLVQPDIFRDCLAAVGAQPMDEMKGQVVELSNKLNNVLTPMQKLNIIRDLALIATADGEVDPGEMDVLYHLCGFFMIRPDFADQVVHDSQQEVD